MAAKKDEEKPAKASGGCLGRLVVLVVFLGLAGLGAAAFFVAQPQDLDDLEGRGPAAIGKAGRNLRAVLRNSLKDGYELSLSEEEINLHLRNTLEARQGGLLAKFVSLDEVAVRLEADRAEIIQVRSVMGRPLTLSMFVRVVQTELPTGTVRTEIIPNGGPYHEKVNRPMIGGRYGRLPVPEGFLLLVLPSFEKLAAVYRDAESSSPVREVDFIEEMLRIRIEDGRLVLDPRGPTGAMPGGF